MKTVQKSANFLNNIRYERFKVYGGIEMQWLTSLSSNIEDVIRSIERESGKATQLIVDNGGEQYVTADLTKRQGTYKIKLDATYYNPFADKESPVPNQELSGEYASFNAIQKALEKKALVLIGNKVCGFNIGIYLFNAGSGGGAQYGIVGKIVYPLLQDDEKAEVERLE